MNTLKKQRGLSGLGILVVLFLVGFFATALVKLLPIYMESWSVKAAIETVVNEPGVGMTRSEIKGKIERQFTVNQINAITTNEITFKNQKGGKILVNANYEKRVHFMQNIDVVLRFEDLMYEVQGK